MNTGGLATTMHDEASTVWLCDKGGQVVCKVACDALNGFGGIDRSSQGVVCKVVCDALNGIERVDGEVLREAGKRKQKAHPKGVDVLGVQMRGYHDFGVAL